MHRQCVNSIQQDRRLMMEDNSEAQMETDVSSTTADVQEMQEVTGSSGNVEMVIVVEKIKDEEALCNLQQSTNLECDKPSTSVQTDQFSDGTSPKEMTSMQVTKSPQNDNQTDIVLPILENTPINQNETPTKKDILPTSSPKVSPLKIISSSFQFQSSEVIVDSSSKEMQNDPNKDKENSLKIIQLKNSDPKTDNENVSKDFSQEKEQFESPIIDDDKSTNGSSCNNANNDNTDKLKDNESENKMDESRVSPDNTEKDASNDSQIETNSDISEKDNNKSISRELKSLINSAKESKIISECTQLTSKTRKSRTAFENANSSLTSLVEAEKIQGNRRNSVNSQKSNCSEKSDKTVIKRSMRSQNPEFVNKVKQFLNSVTGKNHKPESESAMSDEDTEENKSKNSHNDSASTPKKRKKVEDRVVEKNNKLRSDPYCWRCHWAVEQAAFEKTHNPMQCTVCPRSYHYKCLSGTERNKIASDKNWVCPECLSVLHAESSETRSPAMKKISLGLLCELLKYALERMMDLNGVEPFLQPVDRTAFPDYDKYVVHPMDLSLMKNNINEGLYGSTEAFLGDAQWILHNSIIFNTLQSKLTGGARALVRTCRAEMGEIEACPECYAAAHARRPTWFTDVWSTPHILLWAKLKGFPHWPAKGMSVNSSGLVDVRFFGAHDRAWVPARDCYLYSEKDPNNFRTKRQDIIDSMQEAEQHIRNISRKYGKFVYPPFKTQFDPTKLTEQLKMMIPSFEGEVGTPSKEKPGSTTHTPQSAGKRKSRSNSKSSKSFLHEGYMSEGEDVTVTPPRKMADGAEIAKEEDYSINEKNKSIDNVEVDVQNNDLSRKRRRSDLEEAVITIIDSSSNGAIEKRKRLDEDDKETDKKDEEPNEKSKVPIKNTVEQVDKEKDTVESIKSKDNEPSSSTNDKEKSRRLTPIKVVSKVKPSKTSTPKDKDVVKDKNTSGGFSTPNQRRSRLNKSISSEEKKELKRRISRTKSLGFNVEKPEKNTDKRNEKSADNSTNGKEKAKENNAINKTKDPETDKNVPKKNTPSTKPNADSHKTAKDRLQFDDDTSLAVLAREAKNSIIGNSMSGLPTISSVRSLSTTPNNESSPKPSNSKTVEITIEASSDSSIFTPTSTDNVRNMKEAVNKLQRLRNETESPLVGRVGVRAFARMTSPDSVPKEKETMQVEIKTEPIDLDDADRHNEKMDLMKACRLLPVNQSVTNSLREVRINKVVVSPLNTRKTTTKTTEIRVRAKKTFPQPKKVDDGRSELNGKNSMVYIPIQPPMTQAPIRGVRPIAGNGPANSTLNPRVPTPLLTTSANSINTLTAPLVPYTKSSSLSNTGQQPATITSNAVPTGPTIGQVPTVGQVPTNVHTVPLITSVNGHWTFSLQPVMSVGGDESSTPMVNGIAERGNTGALVPLPTAAAKLSALATSSPLNASTSAPTPAPTASSSSTPVPTSTSTGNTPAELPRLQQRPPLLNPLDVSTPIGCVPPPSSAGPLTAKLNQNAVKLTDFFRTLLEDSLEKVDEPAALATALKLQLEQARWRHQQEIEEIKHNHELVLAEMRASFEKEKIRALSDVRRAAQAELEAAVKLTKSKQWCAHCSQEAQFYCCWNTSYCDYQCQRAHWAQHFSVCTQQRKQDGNSNGGPPHDNTMQPPDSLPKTTQAPNMTVGNKLAPLRVYSQDQVNGQKSSIIVSMVEDSSGNQTMKCVGTYKPPGPPQLSPLNINKQTMTSEDNAKKVVTSGGYLIVGAAGSSGNSNIVTSRRAHTIQYYT
ncbi:unnamed protein product [Parnassius apollo]|uniref:(apollo) hypothetical protein n=1 Tax=Parnassius apollo TaxID=110799 RepID=A0A8S3WIS5_PARAO|nr:unnamed protein product [Parnassius apollo]